MDPTFKPDPRRKGSYYRRIEDIVRALDTLQSHTLSETLQFLVLYFGCEKIAYGLVGIHKELPAPDAYGPGQRIKLQEVKKAAVRLDLSVSEQDLDWLFADDKQQQLLRKTAKFTNSARHLRNKLTHDFGPTNVARITQHAPFLNSKMRSFLGCGPEIFEYLRLHYSNVA